MELEEKFNNVNTKKHYETQLKDFYSEKKDKEKLHQILKILLKKQFDTKLQRPPTIKDLKVYLVKVKAENFLTKEDIKIFLKKTNGKEFYEIGKAKEDKIKKDQLAKSAKRISILARESKKELKKEEQLIKKREIKIKKLVDCLANYDIRLKKMETIFAAKFKAGKLT